MTDSQMISVAIIDDQQACVDVLQRDLQQFADLQVVLATTSVDELRTYMQQVKPDLLFVDVEMGKCSGLDLVSELQSASQKGMHVVFYTAFDKYLLDALRASAFDFLLKPYTLGELNVIIDRVRRYLQVKQISQQKAIITQMAADGRFVLQTITSTLFMRASQVLYFTYEHGWVVHLTDGTEHRLRQTTNSTDITQLSPSFVMVNQSCIINLNYLLSIENQTLRCQLCPPYEDVEIYASRRCNKQLKQVFSQV